MYDAVMTRKKQLSDAVLEYFHPAVTNWFKTAFSAATAVQEQAWAAITEQLQAEVEKTAVLIAAPTGSGKTLAAFLAAIDDLVKQAQQGPLPDQVMILYISPLKALSNDIEKNLRQPLTGIETALHQTGGAAAGIRAKVRTGDTPPGEREKMRRRPPQILVTTPESLYLLLTSDSGRSMLGSVKTVVVDEIHALAGNKRGAHLSLSLARLDQLCPVAALRIGLSATQKPMRRIADFLTGGKACELVDVGHRREMDIDIVLPNAPLSALMSNEVWEDLYDQLAELIRTHRTTLIFVNTRRLAERMARHLAERIGEESVTAHHGSLSREHRLNAEQRLKNGALCALVTTASLELGIDIGHVDLVCQMGSPGSIAALMQRIGRSGHAVGETPKGRLFPLSRDDLIEMIALTEALRRGELDTIHVLSAPLDVLAQHIVAEVSAREWSVTDLFACLRQAWGYRDLSRDQFDQVIAMLAQGYASRRGRRAAYLYHDAINDRLRGRRGARLVALQNGGTIPDQFDYEVVLVPAGHRVGSLNEDFAFESLPGDIFQLGNTSYKILKVETGRVLVEDAEGQPPTIPFWFGDRPGRSDELSLAVSQLRQRAEQQLIQSTQNLLDHFERMGLNAEVARQATDYLAATFAVFKALPTQQRVIFERFFDDAGDMHLVLHAPFGSRLMRAWGLALRKRFCRQFNFELQAAALEDCLILSLGETHSFDTAEVVSYLKPESVKRVLIQALLDVPMFATHWRWNATNALAIPRMRNGKRIAPQLQRSAAEDLVAVVFPDQLACLENIRGEREIPDHPLVTQTIWDCIHGVMDVNGLQQVLQRLQGGEINVECFDLNGPSPISTEVITAKPYAFLDDAPAEERRTAAISGVQVNLQEAAYLSIIQVSAIQQVRQECWIDPRDLDELHDALLQYGFITAAEGASGAYRSGVASSRGGWEGLFKALLEQRRACRVVLADLQCWWVATERLHEALQVFPQAEVQPPTEPWVSTAITTEAALGELLRSRLALLGPVDVPTLASDFAQSERVLETALSGLQQEGYVIACSGQQSELTGCWCERRLLARIHQYSRQQRRRASKPVASAAYLQFLYHWHGMDNPAKELSQPFEQLAGWAAPAVSWQNELLPSRCTDYSSEALDQLFLSGQLAWFRGGRNTQADQLVAATPIAVAPRSQAGLWRAAAHNDDQADGAAERVLIQLRAGGAMFSADLSNTVGLLETELENSIKTLIVKGLITSDAFSPLRWLLKPEAQKRKQLRARRNRFSTTAGLLGRWSALPVLAAEELPPEQQSQRLQAICWSLLRRYGVVFRRVLERESLLPPWRQLLYQLRRMEDRGEVRGGRFVDGFSGEQFALPEAVGLLKRAGQSQLSPEFKQAYCVINATDPLNLCGIILPGSKVPALFSNQVLLHHGVPVAAWVNQELRLLSKSCSRETAERYLSRLPLKPKWGRRSR